jgi:hypothetical protein
VDDYESDAALFPVSRSQLWFALVVNAAAVLFFVVADSTSWSIRILAVVIGVALGFAIGRTPTELGPVVAAIAIALAVSLAMVTGTITQWLGLTAIMSAATGTVVRQLALSRSRG